MPEPPGSLILTIHYEDQLKKPSTQVLTKQAPVPSDASQYPVPFDVSQYPGQFGDDGEEGENAGVGTSSGAMAPFDAGSETASFESDDPTAVLKKKDFPEKQPHPENAESFFKKVQSRFQVEKSRLVHDLSLSEERQVAWFAFYELLLVWGENLSVTDTFMGIKMLESYYEARKR